MKKIIKDLWLAVLLIVAASSVLLLSDLGQRSKSVKKTGKSFPEIAVMQIASTPVLDAHIDGVLDRLQEKGYAPGDRSSIHLFNAQGDYTTAGAIAREIVNGPYDLVITSSTVALQVFSKANQDAGKLHVFGAVTDPYGTGVGITGPGAGQHPPYMAGIGTFQPVEEAFRTLKQLHSGIKKVGVVWNPGEQCSEACLVKARLICKELGIELVEAMASNTSEVSEAVRSLLSKGVEAIWIGGDTVAMASIHLIADQARKAGIPVFTNTPADIASGALFGLGADYYTVGQFTADMAISILDGKKPSDIRIENVVPQKLSLNRDLLSSLGLPWSLPPEVEARLSGTGHPALIAMITLVENKLLEQAEDGVEEALREHGLRNGEEIIIRKYSAQGEIGQLPQIVDAAVSEKPDLVVSVTTPALVAVANKVKDIPVVFTVASDPEKLGLFRNGRQENICGIHDNPPVDQLLDMATGYDAGITAVGIIYDAAQMNSVISVEKLRTAGKERNIKVLEATASAVSELTMATQALIQRGAGAIIISADNLATTGFSSIYKAASAAGIPIFVTEPNLVDQGATGAIGVNFFEWGKQSGQLAAQVLSGLPPSRLPITETTNLVRIEPGSHAAATLPARKFSLRMVLYSETAFAERSREGLLDGLAKAGLKSGTDYEFREYNAQGDMTTLSSIMTTVKSDRPDLLMVISTPALQAALRQAGPDTRMVFTGVADAVKAGAGNSDTDHLPNVTGITTRSSFDGMARLIKASVPGVKNVGTLFTPAEVNSVFYRDQFEAELAREGIGLISVPVTSSADIAQAAGELCRKEIQAVAQIVDNLTRPGFALIARKAADSQLPVFIFDSDQMADGASVCLSRDYYDAGTEAAAKVLRILQGEDPSRIPISNTASEKKIYDPEKTRLYRLSLPDSFLKDAERFDAEAEKK